MEQKIAEVIEDTIKTLGFELVQVKIHGTKHKIVEILIERQDGEKIIVGDCQSVSRNISALLDVEDIITGKYFLEVSSAGLERPLVKLADYQKFLGREIKIQLKAAFNGKLKYKGILERVEDETIILKSKNIELKFDFEDIKKANLVFTEEMFRSILNKDKKRK